MIGRYVFMTLKPLADRVVVKQVEIEETNSSTGKKEKKTYYVAVYFESRDREEYYVNGFNALLTQRFDDWYEKDSAKKDIEYNHNAFDNINTIVLY